MRYEDTIRLRHMLDAAQDALSFAEGRAREELDTDRQLVLAIVLSTHTMTSTLTWFGAPFKRTYHP